MTSIRLSHLTHRQLVNDAVAMIPPRMFSGHYIYIESSSVNKKGDTARLASFPISGASTHCRLNLWTHIKGDQVGALAILLRHSYGNGPSDFVVVDKIEGTKCGIYF